MRFVVTITLAALLALAGCAETSVIPLAMNRAQVLVDASEGCSAARAQYIAYRQAAVVTLGSGFDRFVIVSANQTSRSGDYQLGVIVEMFRHQDRHGQNAIDARRVLGPDWSAIVAKRRTVIGC